MKPDFIVIGGGSAGCAVAGRLAEAGKRVTLLEAGKDGGGLKVRVPALMGSLVQNPEFDWCYFGEPDPSVGGRPSPWPAGRRIGGGSAINGMMFIRGHRWDYDRWAELGAAGWDYESCLPYFRRIEDNERGADQWRGAGGPVSVSECRSRYTITDNWIDATVAAGISRSPDLNGESAEGVDHIQLSQRRGSRSTAAGFLDGLGAGLKPVVLPEAEVLKIEIEDGRATGVTFRRAGKIETLHARQGVVVSAGALNTPRLLMLSGLGPARHLQDMGIELVRDLPGVGGNLQDHVGLHLINTVDMHTLNDDAHGPRAPLQVLRYALFGTGALTTGIGHAQAFVRGRPGLAAPNLQLAFSAFSFEVTPEGNVLLAPESSTATIVGLMRPSHRGRVSLRSPDPSAPPLIEHQLLGNDDDVEQLVEGMAIARRIMRQQPITGHVLAERRPGPEFESKEALRDYVRLASISMFHPVGTAKIGQADDPDAVLDAELRLRGIDGLWVADASVMPTIPQGNTNATAIMIGDKAADHILRTAG
ncbi:MAG: FAD-dependent oxidoreductase [Candidatus Andeanibacterium colombiense]|uniref:FAD-dependent oxidoreductase n=1 Tax=Candidatus Andeanibacterium colombiense TaxID=3121345 RepID=A0AAJ6BMB8_9SPHN|nr:MAG: FAD-dependent oxidoreductase [Sphingomonadaceae bacterium]